jgi:hypothetical protein
MFVEGTRIGPSPAGDGRVRYSTVVRFDDEKLAPEEYWFDFPEVCANDLRPSGNPWLALLAAAAGKLNEPLRLADPVDPLLLEGMHENLRVWRGWYPAMSDVQIEAPIIPRPIPKIGGRVVSFFSGGVDSFFTVLYRNSGKSQLAQVDELITVWGFDVPLDKTQVIAESRANLDAAATQLQRPRLDVWTNIRATRLNDIDWGNYIHGGALAAVGLCLESRYRQCLIASSYSTNNLQPWGSHAVTDPNFSTLNLRFVHDGAAFERLQKIGLLKDHPVALDHLRTCWRSTTSKNCSECESCLRTMMAFACFGALEHCRTYDVSKFSVEKIRTMRAKDEVTIRDFEMIYLRVMPPETPPEIREALEYAIAQNRRYYARLRWLERMEHKPWIGWIFGIAKRNFVMDKKVKKSSQ